MQVQQVLVWRYTENFPATSPTDDRTYTMAETARRLEDMPSYFVAAEADAEWLLIGAILVFFMRESRVPCPGQPSHDPTSPRVC